MKVLTTLQVMVFLLLVGFAGGWENGYVTDYVFAVELLSIAVIILSLQLLKIKIRRVIYERNINRYLQVLRTNKECGRSGRFDRTVCR